MFKLKFRTSLVIIVNTLIFGLISGALASTQVATEDDTANVFLEGYKNPQNAPQLTRKIKPKSQLIQSLHANTRWFELFDINTTLYDDDDFNGFYSSFDVSFDLDVEFGNAWVYADIWMKREHGHYELLHTTQVFNIEGQSSFDEYLVSTELLSDYHSGYYDLLIELYDDDGSSINPVATASASFYSSLQGLPLESRYHVHAPDHHGHGGVSASLELSGTGASILLLPLLLVAGMVRAKIERVQ